ncbi:MAG TPA: chemotaxis response regulator protein-glutamate methylesterase [Pseudomonadales bacterium]|nr:chemotaxis response regulator protein-glutamate methylesterase [Pseudomonadales bacterium]
MKRKLRVLVIDDSAVMRRMLTEILASDPDIEVVGSAMDPIIARGKIKALDPDVLTLDIEMPRMDGLSFLEKLMRLHPMPVVMIAADSGSGASRVLDAMRLGAVDFIAKPRVTDAQSMYEYADSIIEKVKAAGRVDLARQESIRSADGGLDRTERPALPLTAQRTDRADTLILIGASTGGTEAIWRVLSELPAQMPPIVIVQHIPPVFSTSFAERLNAGARLEVLEATQHMAVQPGRVVLAPGDFHMKIRRGRGGLFCELGQELKVNHHRPSVDVMFRSALELPVQKIACLLTGMGSDGALAMEQLHDAGAATIAQDERSSVIWGMPGAAVNRGCVDHVEPLERIAARMISLIEQRPRAAARQGPA